MPQIVSADSEIQLANSCFVDENYEEAIKHYNVAIELDSNNAEFFLKRSICYFKLKRFTDSLSDANSSIRIQPKNPKAYQRKGLAAFELEEFETAKSAFEQGQQFEPENSSWRTSIRKCEAGLGIDSQPVQKNSNENTNKMPTPISSSITPTTLTPTPTPTQTPTSTSTIPSSTQNPSQPKIRHEWYQTNSHMIVSIFAKNIKKDQATIDIQEKSFSVTIKMSNSNDYQLDIDLYEKIVPNECEIEFMSTKIEIKLKKFAQYKWNDLENKGDSGPKVVLQTPTTVSAPKPKNWDKIVNEVSGTEPLDDTDGLNKVFQDIFANGTEEQKKAMQKSFLESAGTVLSTNWDEVGKGKVKASPPEGMELHRWDELSK